MVSSSEKLRPHSGATHSRRTALVHIGAAAGSVLLGSGVPHEARAASAYWPRATPEQVGLKKAKLLEAQAFATRFKGGAGCVIRHGKLVHSWGSFSQKYPINSATKSWVSVLLGMAVDDNRFSLDRHRSQCAPEPRLQTERQR